MKLLRYAFLVIAALGALSFSVEATVRFKLVRTDSLEYKKKQAIKEERDRVYQELKAESPFIAVQFAAWPDSDELGVDLFIVAKYKAVADKVKQRRQEILALKDDPLLEDPDAFKAALGRMNGFESSGAFGGVFNEDQASKNWAKFLDLDRAPVQDKEGRIQQLLGFFEEIAPVVTFSDGPADSFREQQADRDLVLQLSSEVTQIGSERIGPDIKKNLVEAVWRDKGLLVEPSVTPPADPGSQDPAKGTSKKDAAGQPLAPKKEDKKESKSTTPQVIRNNPLYFGLGSGVAVLALLVAKIKADYDKNPPVDESGEIISFKKDVLSELASFDYTKMNFWLKTTALGLAGAGIYGSWVNAQAA